MAHILPPLPYAPEALEPHIDAQTMQIHHGKHHQAYVTNLNAAIEKAPELAAWSLDDLCRKINDVPDAVRTAVRNNGGGHWNHSLFWQLMAPQAGGEPDGTLANAITKAFGSFATFKEQFQAAGIGRFGSGWAWLVSANGALSIISTPNQDNPLMDGKHAILGVDVWEHAYYLKDQNRRADYLGAFWNVVNWSEVAKRFAAQLLRSRSTQCKGPGNTPGPLHRVQRARGYISADGASCRIAPMPNMIKATTAPVPVLTRATMDTPMAVSASCQRWKMSSVPSSVSTAGGMFAGSTNLAGLSDRSIRLRADAPSSTSAWMGINTQANNRGTPASTATVAACE